MNTKIRVIGNRILIAEKEFDKKSKGGIYFPDDKVNEYQNMSTEGKIVAMGANAFMDFDEKERPKVGDIVYYQKYDGIGKKYNDKNYRILIDECVFGVSDRYIEASEDLMHE
jgi:co-chaperonin GroES (HSP10)